MGEEHGYLETLHAIAHGRQAPLLSMPESGFGSGTPNKKGLRCAIWLLQGTDRKGARCTEFFRAMERAGHYAIGDSPPEPLTSTHSQLWYALKAGSLLGAIRARLDNLRELVEKAWRVETGACRECVSPFGVVTPCARALIDGKVALLNSLRSKVILGLLRKWKPVPREGENGAYDAAIPLLSACFAAGEKPETLLGSGYDSLTRRYGFHVERRPRGHFAWFTDLGNALEPVYGAGVASGEVVVRAGRDEAATEGERWSRGAALTSDLPIR